jgi:hypothetical protein
MDKIIKTHPDPDIRSALHILTTAPLALLYSMDNSKILEYMDNFSTKYMNTSDNILFKLSGLIVRLINHNRNEEVRDISEHTITTINTNVYSVFKYSKISDNLFYEYIVGSCCVNKLITKFPLFIRTYGLYSIDPVLLKGLRRKEIAGELLQKHLKPISIPAPNKYSEICKLHKSIGLSLQYCYDMYTFNGIRRIPNINVELGLALFQIYYTLTQCRNIFTHYDLHIDNVGVVPLPPYTCMKYIYEFVDNTGKSRTIKFTSIYMVKIIDYGRAYFSGTLPNGSRISSPDILDKLDYIPECNPMYKSGLYIMPEYFSDMAILNNSHDLRLIHDLKQDLLKIPSLAYIAKCGLKYDTDFGTPPMDDSNTNNIYTVKDAVNVILDTISKVDPKTRLSILTQSDKMYENRSVLGTIHVFGINKNMVFTQNKVI